MPSGRSKELLKPPLGTPRALEVARWRKSARRSCSSPRLVPPGRSKELLKPPLGTPRAFEVPAQSSSLSLPAKVFLSNFGVTRLTVFFFTFCVTVREVAAQASTGCPSALQMAAQAPARCPGSVQRTIPSPCSVPQGRWSGSACFYVTARSKRRSKELLKESVLGCTSSVTLHLASLCAVHGYARVHSSIFIFYTLRVTRRPRKTSSKPWEAG